MFVDRGAVAFDLGSFPIPCVGRHVILFYGDGGIRCGEHQPEDWKAQWREGTSKTVGSRSLNHGSRKGVAACR